MSCKIEISGSAVYWRVLCGRRIDEKRGVYIWRSITSSEEFEQNRYSSWSFIDSFPTIVTISGVEPSCIICVSFWGYETSIEIGISSLCIVISFTIKRFQILSYLEEVSIIQLEFVYRTRNVMAFECINGTF